MKYLSIMIVSLSLIGCSSLRDISSDTPLPLNLRLGSVTLTKPVFLCEDKLGYFKPEIEAQLIINHGFDECPVARHLASIPDKTEVELVTLIKHTGYGLFVVETYFVTGRYSNNETQIDFVYMLPWIQDASGQFIEHDVVPWSKH